MTEFRTSRGAGSACKRPKRGKHSALPCRKGQAAAAEAAANAGTGVVLGSAAASVKGRLGPQSHAIRFDDHNRPMYRYTIKYRHEDATYEAHIWAYSESDAEGRLAEIKKAGTISGQSFGRIRA